MVANIKATYKNVPRQTIGPFIATLETFSSSGITVSGISVNNVQISGGTSTGVIEALNIGPTYTILKNDLTHQELTSGYPFNQLRCGDSYIVFQSTNICYSSYRANLIGINGLPTVRLTVTNNDNITISGTLTITPETNEASPSPSTVTVSSTSAGEQFQEIELGKGRYLFDLSFTSSPSDIGRFAKIEFSQCGSV
jgi:hypothetical protein